MSVEENKARLRHWFVEAMGSDMPQNTFLSAARRTLSPVYLDASGTQWPDALPQALLGLTQTLSRLRFTVEHLVGEGDLVAIRVRGEATHTGTALGIAPTGRRITWTENGLFRFEDGLIVESWGEGSLDRALLEARYRRGPWDE